jgi:hypothetical protein
VIKVHHVVTMLVIDCVQQLYSTQAGSCSHTARVVGCCHQHINNTLRVCMHSMQIAACCSSQQQLLARPDSSVLSLRACTRALRSLKKTSSGVTSFYCIGYVASSSIWPEVHLHVAQWLQQGFTVGVTTCSALLSHCQ